MGGSPGTTLEGHHKGGVLEVWASYRLDQPCRTREGRILGVWASLFRYRMLPGQEPGLQDWLGLPRRTGRGEGELKLKREGRCSHQLVVKFLGVTQISRRRGI